MGSGRRGKNRSAGATIVMKWKGVQGLAVSNGRMEEVRGDALTAAGLREGGAGADSIECKQMGEAVRELEGDGGREGEREGVGGGGESSKGNGCLQS